VTIGGVATADVSGQDGVPGAAGGGEEKAAFEGGGVSAGNGSWDRVVRLMRARFTRWGAGGAGAGGEVQWFRSGGLGGASCWAVEQRKVRLRHPERGTIPARGTIMGFLLISIDFLKRKKSLACLIREAECKKWKTDKLSKSGRKKKVGTVAGDAG